LKLLAPEELKSTDESGKALVPNQTVRRAVMVIAAADIVMSLDNVIAVAAAANGNFAMLIFGLAISIPIIVAGATLFMANHQLFSAHHLGRRGGARLARRRTDCDRSYYA